MVGPRSGLFVVAMALAVAASGCLDLSGDEKDKVIADPVERTEHAMQSFSAAVSSREGGDITRLSGTFSGSLGGDEGSSEEGLGMPSSMAFDLEIEWGTHSVVKAFVKMKMGGMTFELTSWCSDERTVVEFGEDVYESRPMQVEDEEALCQGWEDDMGMGGGDPLAMFEDEAMENMTEPVITQNDDGSLTATFQDREEGVEFTVTIDGKGRVSRMEMGDDEFQGHFDVTYGARNAISVPEANQRMPATIEYEQEWGSEGTIYRVTAAPELPALTDFEARWTEQDWESGSEAVITSFSLTGGKQSSEGVSFEYRDNDSDGRVSPGDEYEIWEEGSEEDWDAPYREMVLYDLWAGAAVNESPLPAPGFAPALLLGALALVGVAIRRRK